jgi:hypothetical protein
LAHFTITYHGKAWPAEHDGVELRLRIWRDDDYFQFLTAAVSGIDLVLTPKSILEDPRFWPAVARAAALVAEDAVRKGELPLADRARGYQVHVGIAGLIQAMATGEVGSDLPENGVVHEFDA